MTFDVNQWCSLHCQLASYAVPYWFLLPSSGYGGHRLGRMSLSLGRQCYRNLVYTSAGDRSNVSRWLKGPREFDLWLTYYGDRGHSLRAIADIYNVRKGSKFQNLHYAYRTWPSVFGKYDAIFVLDDDVVLSGRSVNRLFEIREQYDLWLLQPAFHPRGKISHPITRVRPECLLRFTNFVEMTCPLFRRDKLERFLEVYDPALPGYGMDWWFIEAMGDDVRGKIAIVDEVSCINPLEMVKGGLRREIDRLRPHHERVAKWEEIKKRYNIRAEERGQVEFEAVLKPKWRGRLAMVANILDISPFILRTVDYVWRIGRRILRTFAPQRSAL